MKFEKYPDTASYLDQNVSNLFTAAQVYKLNTSRIFTYRDLIFSIPAHKPAQILTELSKECINEYVRLKVKVNNIKTICIRGTRRYSLQCSYGSNKIRVVMFGLMSKVLWRQDLELFLLGQLTWQAGWQMIHPKWSVYNYPSCVQYTNKLNTRKYVEQIIRYIPAYEWLPAYILQKYNWKKWHETLLAAHDGQLDASARLIFDEACAYHIQLQKTYDDMVNITGFALQAQIDLNIFPTSLTQSQAQAWHEISQELASNKRMVRLLYGDVCSGKTWIAILSALQAYKSGYQAIILAPTTILAHQHYETFCTYLPEVPIKLCISSTKEEIDDDKPIILIGTHALLTDKFKCHKLGVIVIDEQHRFGVIQRLGAIRDKRTNILSMSATPIPRTLKTALTGDIPMSILEGRVSESPIPKIIIMTNSEIDNVLDLVHKTVMCHKGVFWVCPSVDTDTRGMPLSQRFYMLQQSFGDMVDFVHSRRKDKEDVLQNFKDGKFRILVSTTVIETGVHIPHANLLIIENPEFFGLAQLYQLMGRVGRNESRGTCILLCDGKYLHRFTKLQYVKSGLELAEYDMKNRGFGDLLGLEQSGHKKWYFLDINKHGSIMIEAYSVAKEISSNSAQQLHSIYQNTSVEDMIGC